MKETRMTNDERKRELLLAGDRCEAYGEIQNLISRAAFAFTYHEAEKQKAFFALDWEDVELILLDYESAKGGTAVAKRIDDVMGAALRPGEMDEAYLCSPVIEIADNAETAKGSWWVMNAIGEPQEQGDPKAFWAFGSSQVKIEKPKQIFHTESATHQ